MIPYFNKIPLITKIIAVMVPFRYSNQERGVRNPGKSIYEKKNRENYHGGKYEM